MTLKFAVTDFEPGMKVGVSSWIEISQEMISGFGELTRDPDPMHVDSEWARKNGPYGGTIAFGFLTLSLLTHMLHDALGTSPRAHSRGPGHYLNYGFDRIRLVAPVVTGSRIRGSFDVTESRVDDRHRLFTTFRSIVEIEGEDRPALVADWLTLWIPAEGG